jgi:hypothetical protein
MLLNLQRQRRAFHPIRALGAFISGMDSTAEQTDQDQMPPTQKEPQIITHLDIAIACMALLLVLFVNMFL